MSKQQFRQQTYVVLDSQVLDLGLVEDVFRMLGYFSAPGNSTEELRAKGHITLMVVAAEFDGLGVRLTLRNNPRNIQLSFRHEYIRCVLEVPDETEFEANKFLGRFAD